MTTAVFVGAAARAWYGSRLRMVTLPESPSIVALTIAGSDSSGGAGLQADLRAFEALGVHGASVVTLITAQGTRGVRKVDALRGEFVRAQLDAVLEDMSPRAVKTGALGTAACVEIVADAMRSRPELPLVLDPVINPTLGRTLLDEAGFAAFVRELVPLATLVLPNRDEAARLAGTTVKTPRQVRAACQAIVGLGARAVLLKGGHLEGAEAVDTFFDGSDFVELRAPRRKGIAMHGLGCTLSALVTGLLARGEALPAAVSRAHAILQRALANPRVVGVGLRVLGGLRDAVAVTEVET